MVGKKEEAKTEAVVDKPVVEEKTAAKKETGKKVPAKKAPVKKAPAAKKDVQLEATVTVQFQGKDIETAQVVEAARKAFAEANPDVEIKTIDVYVKPEENVAYYAVNGEGSGDYKIEL